MEGPSQDPGAWGVRGLEITPRKHPPAPPPPKRRALRLVTGARAKAEARRAGEGGASLVQGAVGRRAGGPAQQAGHGMRAFPRMPASIQISIELVCAWMRGMDA